ncbi:hypothetical protein DVH24_001844 [Malus domestica]|uniref:Uncharacterized protein n=1 Tax=Malus domestica TaxID=3750 RepID=A0A498I486_MALDO|nr:hypothetical protein DVH24_001844 [Malus domestica]
MINSNNKSDKNKILLFFLIARTRLKREDETTGPRMCVCVSIKRDTSVFAYFITDSLIDFLYQSPSNPAPFVPASNNYVYTKGGGLSVLPFSYSSHVLM